MRDSSLWQNHAYAPIPTKLEKEWARYRGALEGAALRACETPKICGPGVVNKCASCIARWALSDREWA